MELRKSKHTRILFTSQPRYLFCALFDNRNWRGMWMEPWEWTVKVSLGLAWSFQNSDFRTQRHP
ncbi:hypothetical protein BDQ94DRAFT_146279 [Aspergillus welwitschiae]|uniref:Uncharacterized protein n=1 Tax=Aspergillus welwitschiae TaxID=1341132 RepID=A0A3F3PYT9_9EURO|nr:hypothetical protein BDQ94DRAFT_146279 [Aspergillus welwitschiae]RDH32028.1 hypothetical protein BDQ94DRAFT_146279 [Aspergillus welwitschiae]